MKIFYPGMARQRLRLALETVATAAAENSCTCSRTGEPPARHHPGCYTHRMRHDLRIVQSLADNIKQGES